MSRPGSWEKLKSPSKDARAISRSLVLHLEVYLNCRTPLVRSSSEMVVRCTGNAPTSIPSPAVFAMQDSTLHQRRQSHALTINASVEALGPRGTDCQEGCRCRWLWVAYMCSVGTRKHVHDHPRESERRPQLSSRRWSYRSSACRDEFCSGTQTELHLPRSAFMQPQA